MHIWAEEPVTDDSIDCVITKLQVYQCPPGRIPPKLYTSSKQEYADKSMHITHYCRSTWVDMTAPTDAQVQATLALTKTVYAEVEKKGGPDNVVPVVHW